MKDCHGKRRGCFQGGIGVGRDRYGGREGYGGQGGYGARETLSLFFFLGFLAIVLVMSADIADALPSARFLRDDAIGREEVWDVAGGARVGLNNGYYLGRDTEDRQLSSSAVALPFLHSEDVEFSLWGDDRRRNLEALSSSPPSAPAAVAADPSLAGTGGDGGGAPPNGERGKLPQSAPGSASIEQSPPPTSHSSTPPSNAGGPALQAPANGSFSAVNDDGAIASNGGSLTPSAASLRSQSTSLVEGWDDVDDASVASSTTNVPAAMSSTTSIEVSISDDGTTGNGSEAAAEAVAATSAGSSSSSASADHPSSSAPAGPEFLEVIQDDADFSILNEANNEAAARLHRSVSVGLDFVNTLGNVTFLAPVNSAWDFLVPEMKDCLMAGDKLVDVVVKSHTLIGRFSAEMMRNVPRIQNLYRFWLNVTTDEMMNITSVNNAEIIRPDAYLFPTKVVHGFSRVLLPSNWKQFCVGDVGIESTSSTTSVSPSSSAESPPLSSSQSPPPPSSSSTTSAPPSSSHSDEVVEDSHVSITSASSSASSSSPPSSEPVTPPPPTSIPPVDEQFVGFIESESTLSNLTRANDASAAAAESRAPEHPSAPNSPIEKLSRLKNVTFLAPLDEAWRMLNPNITDCLTAGRYLLDWLIQSQTIRGKYAATAFTGGQIVYNLFGDPLHISKVKQSNGILKTVVNGLELAKENVYQSSDRAIHGLSGLILPKKWQKYCTPKSPSPSTPPASHGGEQPPPSASSSAPHHDDDGDEPVAVSCAHPPPSSESAEAYSIMCQVPPSSSPPVPSSSSSVPSKPPTPSSSSTASPPLTSSSSPPSKPSITTTPLSSSSKLPVPMSSSPTMTTEDDDDRLSSTRNPSGRESEPPASRESPDDSLPTQPSDAEPCDGQRGRGCVPGTHTDSNASVVITSPTDTDEERNQTIVTGTNDDTEEADSAEDHTTTFSVIGDSSSPTPIIRTRCVAIPVLTCLVAAVFAFSL